MRIGSSKTNQRLIDQPMMILEDYHLNHLLLMFDKSSILAQKAHLPAEPTN